MEIFHISLFIFLCVFFFVFFLISNCMFPENVMFNEIMHRK